MINGSNYKVNITTKEKEKACVEWRSIRLPQERRAEGWRQ